MTWPKLAASTELVAFDTETTGCDPHRGRIVEIGAVRFLPDGTELGRYEQLINPCCHIPAAVQRIHGISNRAVAHAPTFAEAVPGFLEFLGSTDSILIAHNATFDLRFVAADLARCGRVCPDHRTLDTVPLIRRLFPQLLSVRLEALAIYWGLADRVEHRALSDAVVLKGVMEKALERVGGDNPLAATLAGQKSLVFTPHRPKAAWTPPGYEWLGEAIAANQTVLLMYEGGSKGTVPRRVTPKAVVQRRGGFYLQGVCHIDRIAKTFLLSKIRDYSVD